MEKFLGILFCGGRGTRLGEITKYISKSFIPIYDRPVFKYGLEKLEKCKSIDEIIILTNQENDEKLKQTGYITIKQDDDLVNNMPTGWKYIKKITKTRKNGVLIPCDNVSDINIDSLISIFFNNNSDFVFSLFEQNNDMKLREAGCYDIDSQLYYYKHPKPPTRFITVAPYIIKNNINSVDEKDLIEKTKSNYKLHTGYWFDVGDIDSISFSSNYIKNINEKK